MGSLIGGQFSENAMGYPSRLLFCIFMVPMTSFAADDLFQSKEECRIHGGIWAKFGLFGTEMCNLPTKDKDKPCRSKTDCQSECVIDAEKARPGDEAVGGCYGWTLTIGTCLQTVKKGKVQAPICID